MIIYQKTLSKRNDQIVILRVFTKIGFKTQAVQAQHSTAPPIPPAIAAHKQHTCNSVTFL